MFRWRADDGPTLNAGLEALCFFQGIRTSIAKNNLFFQVVIFRGSEPPAPPPLDPRMRAEGPEAPPGKSQFCPEYSSVYLLRASMQAGKALVRLHADAIIMNLLQLSTKFCLLLDQSY